MTIKMLVMDVDGTLTDGHIYMSDNGEFVKAFDIKDGYGIKHILPQLGIIPVIITGRESAIVRRRAQELDIMEIHQGVSNKVAVLGEIMARYGITSGQTAYIGDDVNDLPCMKVCSMTACPRDAVSEVRECVNYVCRADGGRGAVREFIEALKSSS